MGSCSICGAPLSAGGGSISDPQGRPVCVECVEQARRVIMARRAAKARREADERASSQLQQAESDNRLVLDLRTDEALAAAAHQCPACGRFLEMASEACSACGFGDDALPAKGRWGRGGRGKRARGKGGRGVAGARAWGRSDLFPDLDPLATVVIPWATGVLLVSGAALSFTRPWAWSATTLAWLMLATLLAGLMAWGCFTRIGARAGAGVVTLALVVGAGCVLLSRTGVGLPLWWAALAGALAGMLGMGLVHARTLDDLLLRRCWLALTLPGLVLGARLVSLTQ